MLCSSLALGSRQSSYSPTRQAETPKSLGTLFPDLRKLVVQTPLTLPFTLTTKLALGVLVETGIGHFVDVANCSIGDRAYTSQNAMKIALDFTPERAVRDRPTVSRDLILTEHSFEAERSAVGRFGGHGVQRGRFTLYSNAKRLGSS